MRLNQSKPLNSKNPNSLKLEYPALEVKGNGCEMYDQQDFLDNLKELNTLNGLLDESQYQQNFTAEMEEKIIKSL
jgi:hypothetical protein